MFNLTIAERKALLFICIFLLFGVVLKNNRRWLVKPVGYKSKVVVNQPININKASQKKLTYLAGIGPKTAQKIIEYRENNGDFQSKEDLLKVKGIGPQKFSKISPKIEL